jgi:hypothetical protein
VVATVPHDKAVSFFNSLIHVIDLAPIMRDRVAVPESIFGLVTIFILGWFAGVLIACFYN